MIALIISNVCLVVSLLVTLHRNYKLREDLSWWKNEALKTLSKQKKD